jgi:predicted Zn-dependent protease
MKVDIFTGNVTFGNFTNRLLQKRILAWLMWLVMLPLAGLITSDCATNPATGELQLSLISEEQEIQLGRENDAQIVAMLGVYQDPELEAYVKNIGLKLASLSERPQLPWTFRIVDDYAVNAFALPGGFIYVTRGILSYFGTEAELAGVLGHEIAHVTAKHAVERLSSQALLQLGFGIGVAINPDLQKFGQLIGLGLSLLYLRFSREDETQSDEIGLRYMANANYDPQQMLSVMTMLDRVSRLEKGVRLPEWLATHPDPGNRLENISREIDEKELMPLMPEVNREDYLAQVNGMLFGADPREGYFENNIFYHPNLKFRFDFPLNWKTVNHKLAVTGVSEEQDALIQISLASRQTIEAAANEFFSQEGLSTSGTRRTTINSFPAIWGEFSATAEGTNFRGVAAFLAYGGNTFRLVSYGLENRWPVYVSTVERSFRSFNQVADPEVLLVQPMRLNVVTVTTPMTLAEFNRRFASVIPVENLAVLNQMNPDTMVLAGQQIKQVVK